VDFYSNAQICFKFKLEKQKSYERFKTGFGEGWLERENQELRIYRMKNWQCEFNLLLLTRVKREVWYFQIPDK
jgi:hypothetical protein